MSLGSQACLGGADSYVHIGIPQQCVRRNVGLAICQGSTETIYSTTPFAAGVGMRSEDG